MFLKMVTRRSDKGASVLYDGICDFHGEIKDLLHWGNGQGKGDLGRGE